MDALALLCTLHAEGPRTLRLLREAGCRDIREFLGLDSEVVSALLDVPPAVARRLGREGQHLAGRLYSDFLEPEDEATPVFGAGLSSAPAGFSARPRAPEVGVLQDGDPRPLPVASPTEAPEPASASAAGAPPSGDPGARLDRTDRGVMSRVLDRWRDADAQQPATVREAAPPEPEPALPPRLVIAGIPHASLVALGAAGLHSARAVAETSAMALATALGCPFGDARRFQFLAARAADTEAEESELAEPREAPSAPSPGTAPEPRREPTPEVSEAPPVPPVPPVPERFEERLIERPTRPGTGVAGRAPFWSSGTFPPAPEEPGSTGRTVLNWDFVAQPAPPASPGPAPGRSSEDSPSSATAGSERAAPEAGGPFA